MALVGNGARNLRAQTYLEQRLNSVANDPYSLALASYALRLVGSRYADSALAALERLKITGAGTDLSTNLNFADGSVHWEARKETANETTDFGFGYHVTPPFDVETTAYALLAYMHKEDIAKVFMIHVFNTNVAGSTDCSLAQPTAQCLRWLLEHSGHGDGNSSVGSFRKENFALEQQCNTSSFLFPFSKRQTCRSGEKWC